MKSAVIFRLIYVASLAVAILRPAYGQVERASLAGTVTEKSGAIVPDSEFFNALNHPQFSIPGNTTIGSNGVGSIISTARPSRQIQLALRLMFQSVIRAVSLAS